MTPPRRSTSASTDLAPCPIPDALRFPVGSDDLDELRFEGRDVDVGRRLQLGQGVLQIESPLHELEPFQR